MLVWERDASDTHFFRFSALVELVTGWTGGVELLFVRLILLQLIDRLELIMWHLLPGP